MNERPPPGKRKRQTTQRDWPKVVPWSLILQQGDKCEMVTRKDTRKIKSFYLVHWALGPWGFYPSYYLIFPPSPKPSLSSWIVFLTLLSWFQNFCLSLQPRLDTIWKQMTFSWLPCSTFSYLAGSSSSLPSAPPPPGQLFMLGWTILSKHIYFELHFFILKLLFESGC